MAVGIKTIGISFSVAAPIQVEGKPKRQKVLNSFDLVGDLVSTKRLDDESNAEYKQRLMDAMVHPGGPIYDGVINNLTREFGYTRKKALTITLVQGSDSTYIARNPRVDFLSNKVVLYSDWRPGGTAVIDKTINIYTPDSAGYFVSDLVSEINTSTCFRASLDSSVRSNLHSTNLIQTTSDNYVESDIIEASTQTRLSANLITEDSITFSNTETFDTEVSVDPTAEGEYKLDLTNGKISLFVSPLGNEVVSYHYAEFPLQVDYSLIKVYSLQDADFVSELFEQEELDSGESIDSLPNTEGAEIFHQLFTETKVFWGE